MVKYNFLEKTIRNLWNSFNKSNTICQLLIIIAITYILFHISNKYDVKTEGFSQPSKFVTKENNDLYDDFYCSIYDDLVYDTTRNEFEVQEITNIAKINKNSNILDIGSGKGHHVNHFRKHGINVTGLDKSKSMIKLSQK
jgi:cyclopropane fatty-acyl-phospholipid synthase-like methyltransferase